MLNLHQLQVFAAVVEHGTLTAASRSLHLTQPAVSAQIRQLERFVGAPVLFRDGRKMALTEAGRSLYRYTTEVLGATDALRRDLDDIGTGEQDHIVVGGSRAFGRHVLPVLLCQFQTRHPELRMSLLDALSPEVVDWVRSGRVDLAVVHSDQLAETSAKDLFVARLCDDEQVVVESATHGFSKNQRFTLEELAAVPFIRTWIGEATPESGLNHLLAAGGLGPTRIRMELSTWEGVKEAVRAGIGVAVMFRSVVQAELARGELRVVTVEGYRRSRSVDLICSPHRRRGQMSTVFEELVDFLRSEVPQVVAEGP